METTEQKINLQLNIDGYKFFETNQSFDDDQTYSNLIQGFIDSRIHNMFKQVHLENQIHDVEFGAFKINGELLPSIKFKLIEDPIHDWFLIGAEDQIILLAKNPLYETGQN